jgi:DNA-directed RNA polymerase subunit beta
VSGDDENRNGFIPESFKVLLKELQALGLENRKEIHLKEMVDYDETDYRSVIEGDNHRFDRGSSDDFKKHGSSVQRYDEDSDQLVDEDSDADEDSELLDMESKNPAGDEE